MAQTETERQWGMVIDTDRCTGCQACVVACQSENNVPVSDEKLYLQRRYYQWIRIERYWEGTEEAEQTGDYSKVKARFIPMLCQHCANAPCEPVCPVYATYHNNEGLNVQVYNRCIGTRYCANNDPYNVRFFNFFQPTWPDSLKNQLNPDVTVRSRGVMEKCTFCVQRIRRSGRDANAEGRALKDGDISPACVQSCPTSALNFGDLKDPQSKVSIMAQDRRAYRVLEEVGTDPSVIYLKKVDPHSGHDGKEYGH
jgi:molybdopterin-containing oxidoreductase family iron-sulfur binding subunit